jgi:hypothetical protein
VRDKAGKAVEVVLELSCFSTYRRVHEALHSWLQPAVDDALKLRFIARDHHDPDAPSKNVRTLKLKQLTAKEFWLHQFLAQGNNPYRPEVLFFEVLPFSVRDMDSAVLRDVVLADCRLRKLYQQRARGEAEAGAGSPSFGADGGRPPGAEHLCRAACARSRESAPAPCPSTEAPHHRHDAVGRGRVRAGGAERASVAGGAGIPPDCHAQGAAGAGR